LKTNWTNDDRAAFREWLQESLGQKFLRYLKEELPAMPEGFDQMEMASYGFEVRGYQKLINKIDEMSRLPGAPLPPGQFVETLTD
jgi:hypothetical protein